MLKNVLLVDDDLDMLRMLQEGFAGHADAFAVLTAGDGAEALDCLKRHSVSLVVTDLKMPRMDGFELLAAIMAGYPDIPVIVMSGLSTPGLERLARRGGAVGFIVKPFSIDALAQQILAMLRKEAEGGTLHNVSTGMFLQLIEMEQKSCTIRLADRATGKTGVLSFMEGELFDARVGGVQGERAAHEIFAWDHVSLSIQNGCSVREKRIRKELNLLILEAMRRKDEGGAAMDFGPGAPPLEADRPLQRLRVKILGALGPSCGLEDVVPGPDWSGRLKRISACGERLNLGRLTLGYVDTGDARGYILVPGDGGAIFGVNPACPRDKLMQVLGQ
ncbi:MAG: response regulator [Desulfobacterales bacterium]